MGAFASMDWARRPLHPSLMQPIEIFRTGRHTATSGTALVFGEADLLAIASGYDPELSPAPIVVGHPALDAPAYGWIEKLTVTGDRLVAVPRDVDPAFADLVQAGRYRTRSASLYLPDAPNNPTPGKYYLRHVGFLGAQPPAIKGLKPVSFADGDGAVCFSDIGFTAGLVGRIFRRVREWMIETQGAEAADRVIPDWEVQELANIQTSERAAEDAGPNTALPFADPPVPEDSPMTDPAAAPVPGAEELARRAADLEAREAAFAARARDARRVEDAATVEAAIAAGRLPKGLRDQAIALFSDLGEDTVTFGDVDAPVSSTSRALFADLLSKLPVPVALGEIATGPLPAVDFGDAGALALVLTTEMQEAAKRGEIISPAEALGRVKRGAAA